MAESRVRWTETDPGPSIWATRYADCGRCGGTMRVLYGTARPSVIDRHMTCDCGRRCRQIIY